MFECAKTNKVSQNIVNQIRKAIFSGVLKAGDKLPLDKELMNKFGVSKGSLREALRSLEVLGLLEIRKGALGGAFVTEVDTEKAKEGFSNFFVFRDLSLKNLFDVRLVLEPHIAECAASTITGDDLQRLEQILQETRDALQNDLPLNYRGKEVSFHLIIANATQNPLLIFLLDYVETLLLDAKEILNPGRDFSKRVLEAHERIYKALVARDANQARNAIIQDIREVEEALLRIQKEKNMSELRLRMQC
ncbi:MAG: FadR family transcriptional regulator [Proteobacteria bacterium]|nr:FadR family transcriptional regulator [Pseudomonadota bacterium]MBU2227624.1 FadR family transcriptional regulator [Pseudomonadota bacterium]MBU2261919.1 FadR family transcriptional regulator [Pseudomonadota bacterium]